MAPHFDITADPERKLLRVVLGGFFEQDDIRRFAVAKARAHAELAAAPQSHVTLVDVRDCRIQTQEIATAFAGIIVEPRYRARRIAFIAAGSLAKLQIRRLIHDVATARQFDDEASALAWLFEAEQQAA